VGRAVTPVNQLGYIKFLKTGKLPPSRCFLAFIDTKWTFLAL